MTRDTDQFSVYAPIRNRRDLWWKYALLAVRDGHVNAAGMISNALPQMIENYLVPMYATGFREATAGQPNADHLWMIHSAKISVFRHWVPLISQYELNGRQIFDLDDNLVELLRQTDLGEATLEQWNAPYETFYVRFGKQEDIRIPFENDEFEYLEGAYVARTPFNTEDKVRLKFGFTTVKADGRGVMLPGYFIDILPDEQHLTVANAVEVALARRLAELQDQSDDDEAARAFNSYQRNEVNDSAELLRAGATLLVNALFYLENIRTNQPPQEPGRDTPVARVARWHQMPDKRHIKERSALTADGYALVRLVGREVNATTTNPTGSSVRAHWRRGHWRQQRHGVGLTFVKRLWIKPVLVAALHSNSTPVSGHIYI